MLLDSGVLKICSVENIANPGDMPIDKLVEKSKHWYGDRTVGMTRYFVAKQADNEVERLVRIWQDKSITTRNYCVCDEVQYKILQVQHLLDEDSLRVTDLTLERLGDPFVVD